MPESDERQPPDFSQPYWLLESFNFYYSSRQRKIKFKKVFTEELAGKKGSRLSDYTSDPFWFGIVSFYLDSDNRNRPERYKQFGFNEAKESSVIGINISIFGWPAVCYLGFVPSDGKQVPMRAFCWFVDKDGRWQMADIGDSVDFDYLYAKKGRIKRVIVKIKSIYGDVKSAVKIFNPRF